MNICSLCNKPIPSSDRKYSAEQVRISVHGGLRPKSLTETARALDISEDALISDWIQKVKTEASDWTVCNECAGLIESAIAQAEANGRRCDFCGTPLFGDDPIAMIDESGLVRMEAIGALLRPGPPTMRDVAGKLRWVACKKCMDRAVQILQDHLGK
ncbi:MAG TPA: hypothetical protein VFQ13_11700 [Anaerolineales bacterium]|nr:hypothetical protein [Anaerolineales bacterium]